MLSMEGKLRYYLSQLGRQVNLNILACNLINKGSNCTFTRTWHALGNSLQKLQGYHFTLSIRRKNIVHDYCSRSLRINPKYFKYLMISI